MQGVAIHRYHKANYLLLRQDTQLTEHCSSQPCSPAATEPTGVCCCQPPKPHSAPNTQHDLKGPSEKSATPLKRAPKSFAARINLFKENCIHFQLEQGFWARQVFCHNEPFYSPQLLQLPIRPSPTWLNATEPFPQLLQFSAHLFLCPMSSEEKNPPWHYSNLSPGISACTERSMDPLI